jgi:hypothetical protein
MQPGFFPGEEKEPVALDFEYGWTQSTLPVFVTILA